MLLNKAARLPELKSQEELDQELKTIFAPSYLETIISWCQQNPAAFAAGLTIGLMILCYKLKDFI